MASPSKPASDNQHAYIPPAARAAMSQQMQSVPAHLQQYVGSERPAFIPQRAQQELTSYMQSSAPAHLKQYAGAFVEQNMVAPSLPAGPVASGNRPPVPDRLNLSHSGDIAAEQPNAQFHNLFQPDQAPNNLPGQPAVQSPADPNALAAPTYDPNDPNRNFDFILNPQSPKRSGKLAFNLGANSMPKRLLIVIGGVVLLIMLASLLKGSLAGGNKTVPDLISLVQDQQELITVVTDGTKNASDPNLKNFAYTAQYSLQSERSQLIAYLKQGYNRKVSTKEADLKLNKLVSSQLASALSTGSYDSTFSSTAQSQLKAYQQDLQQAYKADKGIHGRALLSDFYNDAGLLLKQAGGS